MSLLFLVAIDPILFKIAGDKDLNNILDKFEFLRAVLECLKTPHRLIRKKMITPLLLGLFSCVLFRIF